jgi:glycosyltransferase involved in cell wall biosynthesis
MNVAESDSAIFPGRIELVEQVRERASQAESVSGRVPALSIGLPVYNGERYLRQSIESILGQTFRDFELIISDNASTDATGQISQEYAAKDARIRYSRNPANVGGANNSNITFRLARGRYFRLAAHDDICAPRLIERCIEVLEARPEVVLCHSGIIAIDEEGKESGVRYGTEGIDERAHVRLRHLSSRHHPCDATYGVVRSEAMRKTSLLRNYTNSDRALLCELALQGPFALVREPLFYKRYTRENQYKDWRGRMAWFLPELRSSGKATYPNWSELFHLVEATRNAPLPASERRLCQAMVALWSVRYAKGLAWDLVSAARMKLHSQRWRTRRYADEDLWR